MVIMNWRKWLDEFVLAGKGILLATHEKRFWYGFVPSFIFFGMLMNLLAGGTSKFELMGALGFPANLQIFGSSFLAIFGINQPFLDWLPIFDFDLASDFDWSDCFALEQEKGAEC